MSVRNKLKGLAISAYLSEPLRKMRGGVHEVGRRVRREDRVVELYFQVDDPYSYLLAQLVPRLAAKYDVGWELHVVGPPEPDVDPQPAMLRKWRVRHARELTRFYRGLELPDGTDQPEGNLVQRANQVLIKDRPFEDALEAAVTLADALWRKDKDAVAAAQGKYLFESSGNILPSTKLAMAQARKRGYYSGGAFYYKGEWYNGIDRLRFLEERLDAETGAGETPSVLEPIPMSERGPETLVDDGDLEIELFFSFRSPYSYLALDRAAALSERTGVPLRVRPVLPMVMRGASVPRIKRMFLVRDAKREADRLGIPFGRICDPLGGGVERCLAFFVHADRAGGGLAFTQSAARGIWSEALDPGSYADMKKIVSRAGLEWDDMRPAMDDDSWKDLVETNAEALLGAELWGVPTFRAGSYTTWGQDRIPLLEDRIRRHLAAAGAGE